MSTRAQIKHLHHELKVTTICVTHDQIEAMTLDRVVVMNKGVVQQVGSPTEIYDRPENVFVAGFIGNPAMNLVEGKVKDGTFTAENISVPGIGGADGPLTRWISGRGCDVDATAQEKKGAGMVSADVYALELLGDATMVTVRAGSGMVAVKAAKDYRARRSEIRFISLCRGRPAICLTVPAVRASMETDNGRRTT